MYLRRAVCSRDALSAATDGTVCPCIWKSTCQTRDLGTLQIPRNVLC